MGRPAIVFVLAWIAAASGGIGQAAPAAAHGAPAKTQAPTKSFDGIVTNVTLANPEREIRSEIVAVNDAGRLSSFLVTATSTIYDLEWKGLALRKIRRGDRVRIRYVTTADGLNISRSIHITGK